MQVKQTQALIISLLLFVSVFSPTACFGADTDADKKQLAVLSDQRDFIQTQLGAMHQEVSDSAAESINHYLSGMSPATRAAWAYFSDVLKQYGSWLVLYTRQNVNWSQAIKVTPVTKQF